MLELASCIDEGRPVDWEAAESRAGSEQERAVVAGLRGAADVARVPRHPELPASEADVARGLPAPKDEGLVKWGPLTVLAPLGHGAFGTVFRARDALEREVALKLLSVGRDLGAGAADRLVSEGPLLARVKHENVVDVYGVDCVDGAVGLWMEFV